MPALPTIQLDQPEGGQLFRGARPRSGIAPVDHRAAAAGMWAARTALLLAAGIDENNRFAQLAGVVVIGVLISGVTRGRFPTWRDRPSRLRWVPIAASATLAVVLGAWAATSGGG